MFRAYQPSQSFVLSPPSKTIACRRGSNTNRARRWPPTDRSSFMLRYLEPLMMPACGRRRYGPSRSSRSSAIPTFCVSRPRSPRSHALASGVKSITHRSSSGALCREASPARSFRRDFGTAAASSRPLQPNKTRSCRYCTNSASIRFRARARTRPCARRSRRIAFRRAGRSPDRHRTPGAAGQSAPGTRARRARSREATAAPPG